MYQWIILSAVYCSSEIPQKSFTSMLYSITWVTVQAPFTFCPVAVSLKQEESCADATQKSIFSQLFVGGRRENSTKKSQAENNNQISSLHCKGVETSIPSMWRYRKNSWALPTEPKSRVFQFAVPVTFPTMRHRTIRGNIFLLQVNSTCNMQKISQAYSVLAIHSLLISCYHCLHFLFFNFLFLFTH